MNHVARFLTALGSGVWVASVAFSQHPASASLPAPTAAPRPAAVRAQLSRSPGGELWGSGNGYLATFEPAALSFRPLLGSRVAPEFRFALESIGRRSTSGETLTPVGAATCSHAEQTVSYARPQLVETYEVRAEGVEQSFRFATLPPGNGDLIVRGRLTTSLSPPAAHPARTLTFVGSDHQVHIGAVTGIDAQGARAEGWLQVHDGVLELGLPATFVERAALPLVLDPLIGSVGVAAQSGVNPDVAYDASTGTYLVVHQNAALGVSAQRIDRAGARVGEPIAVAMGGCWGAPRVASVKVRGGFVVVWSSLPNFDIRARWVDAATGTMTAAITVAGSADIEINPDVSGEATDADDDAVAVWENQTLGRIEACQIQVSPTGALNTLTTTTLWFAGSSHPAISRSGGSVGRHLVVWQAGTGVLGLLLDRDLTLLMGVLPLSGIGIIATNPAVDGDGSNWTIAWESATTTAPSDHDIRCCSLNLAAGSADLGVPVIVEGDAGDDEIDASVCWNGGSCLIGFSDQQAGAYDAHVKSIDPFSCLDCEGGAQLDPASSHSTSVRIASELSGDPTASVDKALLVWADVATGAVSYRIYRSDDGLVTDLGGQCGNGGRLWATCARAGNAGFTVQVIGADTYSAAFLVLSLAPVNLTCGPCTLVPDLFTGFVFSAGYTDWLGRATASLGIPAGLPATQFYAQWAIVPNNPACSRLGVDLSNAARVLTQ